MAELGWEEVLASTHVAPRSFYARPTETVARDLLGATLVHRSPSGLLAGMIVEVEAYLGQDDLAAHSCAGITPRTRVIFGPPGHAYVYRVYGLHCCLNVVAEPDGVPGCVLIRSLQPVCGTETMRSRRKHGIRTTQIANGPGKLTRAMAIGMDLYGADLMLDPLTVRIPNVYPSVEIKTTTRVGITQATALGLRFFIAYNDHVSRPWGQAKRQAG